MRHNHKIVFSNVLLLGAILGGSWSGLGGSWDNLGRHGAFLRDGSGEVLTSGSVLGSILGSLLAAV